MAKRHNQYRNHITRQHGSSSMDLTDKNKVKQILEKMHITDIEFDQFLVFWPYDSHCSYSLHDSLTEQQVKQSRKIRHPDVIGVRHEEELIIIEIDGSYHKDYDHDKDYDDAEITYVKLNKWYLNKENISWEEWIKQGLDYH